MSQTRPQPADRDPSPPTPTPTAAVGWRRHLPTPLQLLLALFVLLYSVGWGLAYADLAEDVGPERALMLMKLMSGSPY